MRRKVFFVFIFLLASIILIFYFIYNSRAVPAKANILIDAKKIVAAIPQNWQAFAQGGEEQGVSMFANVIPQTQELSPRYIRVDHIYDYYNLISRDTNGQLSFNFSQLDKTVCDIFATGAKPFFSLSYMPKDLSSDGTIVGQAANWSEWQFLVQKTIEHYSGKSSVLCSGKVTGAKLNEIYYEVWNEPDLFGDWKMYGGKNYKTLYFYSSKAAQNVQNVNNFYFGGPATTGAYKNWVQDLLDFISSSNLRIDFLSWHHYSKDPDDYSSDVSNINGWLADPRYERFRILPKIISEWGYDSDPNLAAQTGLEAPYTVAVIRNLIEQKVEMAFAFELKDGPNPRWGFLSYQGDKKPRYFALKFLNQLKKFILYTKGEGTYVRAIATRDIGSYFVVLTNYDRAGQNVELVPVTFRNLPNGIYSLTLNYLEGESSTIAEIRVSNGIFKRNILLQPNTVIALELQRILNK